MAQLKLNTGDPFPTVTLNLTDSRTLTLPDGLEGRHKVVLFYRGNW